LRLIGKYASAYDLVLEAIAEHKEIMTAIQTAGSSESLDYDEIYDGKARDWRLLPAFDHPDEPARCLVTGTGLTHKASAENRQAMHAAQKPAVIPDSMRMSQWGLEAGRPAAGKIGVAPEWFYKGCGTILRAHGEPLEVPRFGDDGGEEAEVAGAYVIDDSGGPRRVGLVLANEFSDHKMEEKNYL